MEGFDPKQNTQVLQMTIDNLSDQLRQKSIELALAHSQIQVLNEGLQASQAEPDSDETQDGPAEL